MEQLARTHSYFLSDVHLGAPDSMSSKKREQLLLQFLTEKAETAKAIYIVGDLFDFWFEYKHAIPKGFVRTQAKLAELCDKGIEIHLFTGNHDMWMFDYLPQELGVKLHRNPIQFSEQGKKFFVGHGDGLGPGDASYKVIKKFFNSRLCQWMFARIHPNFGIAMANFWSSKSRKSKSDFDKKFLGEKNEWLAIYAKEVLQAEHFDYFLFGHRHLPLDIQLTPSSRYLNLGDWIHYFSYAEFDGTNLVLKKYPENTLFPVLNKQ